MPRNILDMAPGDSLQLQASDKAFANLLFEIDLLPEEAIKIVSKEYDTKSVAWWFMNGIFLKTCTSEENLIVKCFETAPRGILRRMYKIEF